MVFFAKIQKTINEYMLWERLFWEKGTFKSRKVKILLSTSYFLKNANKKYCSIESRTLDQTSL
jgi:hypothetical protein